MMSAWQNLEFQWLAAHRYKVTLSNITWRILAYSDAEKLSLGEVNKQDKLYKDAMVTAAVSVLTEVAEELLSYFVEIGNRECFTAVLFICFDLLQSDIIEELS